MCCTNSSYGYNGLVDNKNELGSENDAATARGVWVTCNGSGRSVRAVRVPQN